MAGDPIYQRGNTKIKIWASIDIRVEKLPHAPVTKGQIKKLDYSNICFSGLVSQAGKKS